MKTFLATFFVAFVTTNFGVQGQQQPGVIERSQSLSDKLGVSWTVNFGQELVTFVLTAETHGFIGFGLSPKGGMNGADVIIGGVGDNGEVYFSDRYASTTVEPKIDDHQDWFLIDAFENATHTVLHFNRSLDTCDTEDLKITNDTSTFIWSLGATDKIEYHGQQRGASSVNILDSPMPIQDTSKFEIWDVRVNTTIPATDTTYWCTLHKSPPYASKRHVVGFEAKLDTPEALYHNHHMNLHHCAVEAGSELEELMESYLNHPGGFCYDPDDTGIQQLLPYCQSMVYVWAKGGEPVFLPENVGYPMNVGGVQEYFFLEIHYDNPQSLAGVSYETGIRAYTTDDLRPIDAGLMVIGYAVDISQTIPPSSVDFVQSAHCSSRCTGAEIPPEGVDIFNVLHHAHLSGRKLKLRQFRPQEDGKFLELPWVSNDDNYDFNFQQNRPLKEPVKILPGDHLTVECTYDTTWKEPPSGTFGGFSTREEMCEAIFMYYPAIPLGYCSSYHPIENLLPIIGIEEIDSSSNSVDPMVVRPEELAGLNYSTVVNTKINWTTELRNELETKLRFNDHMEECYPWNIVADKTSLNKHGSMEDIFYTSYPKDFVEYSPPGGNCGK